jgi:hypothetical protein
MYNNPYINVYNPQASIDRINGQIAELEKMKQQIPQQPVQPTNLTQNFQLAPTTSDLIRYAGSIDEVHKNIVLGDTPYFSKDMSVVWIKNTKGDIKTYELNEIIPKDEKDIQIELLQAQIDELKKGLIRNEQHDTNVTSTEIATDTKWNDESTRDAAKEVESTSV